MKKEFLMILGSFILAASATAQDIPLGEPMGSNGGFVPSEGLYKKAIEKSISENNAGIVSAQAKIDQFESMEKEKREMEKVERICDRLKGECKEDDAKEDVKELKKMIRNKSNAIQEAIEKERGPYNVAVSEKKQLQRENQTLKKLEARAGTLSAELLLAEIKELSEERKGLRLQAEKLRQKRAELKKELDMERDQSEIDESKVARIENKIFGLQSELRLIQADSTNLFWDELALHALVRKASSMAATDLARLPVGTPLYPTGGGWGVSIGQIPTGGYQPYAGYSDDDLAKLQSQVMERYQRSYQVMRQYQDDFLDRRDNGLGAPRFEPAPSNVKISSGSADGGTVIDKSLEDRNDPTPR